jgi:hypothetical protein
MAQFKVIITPLEKNLLRTSPVSVRIVTVPDSEITSAEHSVLLEQIFHYGQNDFQPLPVPSVSVGDIAIVGGKHYLCNPVGWFEIGEVGA